MMILAVSGSGAWYVNSKFATLNALSKPPLGPDGQVSPAQSVLMQIENGEGVTFVPRATHAREPVSVSGPRLADTLPSIESSSLVLQETTDTPPGSITVLLMGVDARPGEPIDIGVRPDSLQVLHMSGDGAICRILSIPRDTRANLPGYGQSKVNHALSVGGVPYEILVVEQLLGIEIDHFGLIDFAGLVGVVDAIGGVKVDNPRAFEVEGTSFPEGEQMLSGEEALTYVRFRGDNEGDFGRQRRQQDIIRGVLQQTDSLDAARAVPAVLGDIEGHFKTDLSVTSLVGLANDFRSTCTSASLESVGLDGTVSNDWDDLYDQELSFVHVSDTEIAAKTAWLTNGSLAHSDPGIALIPDRRTVLRA